jgi:protein-tyrosine phosphatase
MAYRDKDTNMDNVTIDWTNQRMTGFVRDFGPTDGWMDIPLISPVKGDLYQGGCKDGVNLGSEFKTVVSLYKWERYVRAEGVDLYEFEAYDSSSGLDEETLFKASDAALKGLEKGKTLIHCQAGLNRSGLTAAFTLMRMGMSAQDAIDLLRKQRSGMVLCNQTFVKQLHDLEHRRDEWFKE